MMPTDRDRHEQEVADLFQRDLHRLVGVARSFGVPETEAEDVVVECFARLLARRRRTEDVSDLGAYVYRSVVNRSIDVRRRAARVSLMELTEARCPAHWDSPDSVPEIQGLGSLTSSQRAIVRARIVEGLPTKEVAVRLGVSEGTVKSRIHRARSALRVALEPWIRAEQAQIEGAES